MREVRVLSVYEGFFSGGARILHSDVVRGLHGPAQRHSVLSLRGEVHREATRQRMEDDACYRALTGAGVPVSALRGAVAAVPDGPGDHPAAPAGAHPEVHTEADLAAAARAAAGADVVLSLKEQPLSLLNHPRMPFRPVVVCLHRSDPHNQGGALEALLAGIASGRVRACVCCAESTRDAYAAAGVPAGLLHVIPNGVDLERFRPDPLRRARVRADHGIAPDAPVVVFAARWDAMKNVPLFLAAALRFLREQPAGRVLMCGAGMTEHNEGLTAAIGEVFAGEPQLARRIGLLGVRPDMEAVYAAGDVVSLTSSWGEAAPLCLIEGMMCGAVPVTTAVGDAAALVDGRGLVTPPDADAIAAAWAVALTRRTDFAPALGLAREVFSRTRMIAAYADLITRVHAESAPAAA
jgi:glycosyltransferase involved in cell wall biosynthesis